MAELDSNPQRRIRVFLLAGWGKLPDDIYFPKLIKHMKKKKSKPMIIKAKKSCSDGNIDVHVNNLAELVIENGGPPDGETFFIGQSIGFQIVLRYLASLPEGQGHIGGIVGIAAWLGLDKPTENMKPWCETPIDFKRVEFLSRHIAIFCGQKCPLRNGSTNEEDWLRAFENPSLTMTDGVHYLREDVGTFELQMIDAMIFSDECSWWNDYPQGVPWLEDDNN